MMVLPHSFTSLYRLFLRTASASVLHHRAATRNLRALWRPVFEGGANATKQLQQLEGDDVARQGLETFLKEWNVRMDNTLALLYNSSTSRGLAHQLTRNLSKVVQAEKKRVQDKEMQSRTWDAQSPPSAKDIEKRAKAAKKKEGQADRFAILDEIIHMAEGRDRISLGRIQRDRRATKR